MKNKKIIFVGFMATVLLSAGANAEIASKNYVDSQNTAQTTAINTTVINKADKATTLAGYGITDAATSAQGALADTAVQPAALTGLATSASVTAVDDRVTATNVNVTTNAADIVTLGTNKADKATTLAGYGITDAATSASLTGLATEAYVDGKDTAVRVLTTGLEANKADKSTTYTKAEVDTAVGAKADATALTLKANSADVYLKTETYTKTEVDTANLAQDAVIATKATTSDITTAIAGKADTTAVNAKNDTQDAAILLKADAAATTAALLLKANDADLGVLAKAAPGACGNAANKCVLTFDGAAYSWEVVER